MQTKSEGAAFPPIPVYPGRLREASRPGRMPPREPTGELRCEMCGGGVVASHGKRICPRCGFLTSWTEGVS